MVILRIFELVVAHPLQLALTKKYKVFLDIKAEFELHGN